MLKKSIYPWACFIILYGTLGAHSDITNTYSVTYHRNGIGSAKMPADTKRYAQGEQFIAYSFSESTNGMYFAGWNTAPDGTGMYCIPFRFYTMSNSNVNLYAMWTRFAVIGRGTFRIWNDALTNTGKAPEPVITADFRNPGRYDEVQLAAKDTYVYIAAGKTGLKVLDFTAPDSPRLAAQIDGITAYCAGISGSTVFIGNGTTLIVADISDPQKPDVIHRMPVQDGVVSIAVSGRFAYCIGGNGAMRVLDMTDVRNPVIIGSCSEFFSRFRYIHAANGWVYLADAVNGVWVADVCDPAHPRIIGSYRSRIDGKDYRFLGLYFDGKNILIPYTYYYEPPFRLIEIMPENNRGQKISILRLDVTDPARPLRRDVTAEEMLRPYHMQQYRDYAAFTGDPSFANDSDFIYFVCSHYGRDAVGPVSLPVIFAGNHFYVMKKGGTFHKMYIDIQAFEIRR